MQASLESPEGPQSIISRVRSRLQRKGLASGPFLIYCTPALAAAGELGLPASDARMIAIAGYAGPLERGDDVFSSLLHTPR